MDLHLLYSIAIAGTHEVDLVTIQSIEPASAHVCKISILLIEEGIESTHVIEKFFPSIFFILLTGVPFLSFGGRPHDLGRSPVISLDPPIFGPPLLFLDDSFTLAVTILDTIRTLALRHQKSSRGNNTHWVPDPVYYAILCSNFTTKSWTLGLTIYILRQGDV